MKIITHSGHFHADDIFAVAVLSLVLEKGKKNFEIVRSRDKEVIEKGDFVVDVGGDYDEGKNRFDHHQESGAGHRENGIPYASFGLVWKKFGEELCGNSEIVDKIDRLLIQWIDATDNGVQTVETKVSGVYPYDIGLYFNTFTPSWNENNSMYDKNFTSAVDIAKNILSREIQKRKNLMEAEKVVDSIYQNSEDKRIIVMDKKYPYNGTLSKYKEPLFVISPKEDGTWSSKSIKDDENSFISRKYFPESWSGKSDSDLEKINNIPGSIFCHRNCFIAINKTMEGAIEMARLAINS